MEEVSTKKQSTPKAKVVFIGNSLVGKTALFHRFEKNVFVSDTSTTVGGACANITVPLGDNEQVPLIVWDTAGQESFRSIVPMYFSRAAFILIVYDISLRSSFDGLKDWFDLSKDKAPEWSKLILIGNKSDLDDKRKVTYAEGSELCNNLGGFMFTETSAVTGAGIKDLLVALANTAKDDALTRARMLNETQILGDESGKKKCC